MALAKLIAFDRPLAAALIPGRHVHTYSEADVAAASEEAFRRGVDSARTLADQQMVELRADIGHLSEGVFRKLGGMDALLVAQLREALPGLAVELARRLLAGYEPPAEAVSQLCEETLAQLFPERENLEVSLAPRDLALLQKLNPEWMQRYPGLRVRSDARLESGDCEVRSRFGLMDARRATKLDALARNLNPA